MSLLDTPGGFVWLFDRLTLEALPDDEQRRWRDFHEDVWEAMLYDDTVHEGCAPASELRQAEFDLQRTIEEHESETDDARAEGREQGYAQACTDILARVEAMTPEIATPNHSSGFDEARKRMAAGIVKLRDRGPAPEPEPTSPRLVAA